MNHSGHKGVLVVIEGTDGSGKATQAKLLTDALKTEGVKVETLDFPRYYDNFMGEFIGSCLAGKHGDFAALDPRIASVLYAADRFESRDQIKKWLDEGAVVILDRYVSSNQIHQGGKISDEEDRKKFLGWLETLEFEVFDLPRPEVIVYLDVTLQATLGLLQGAQARKVYTGGKKDAHEGDINHLSNAKESAVTLVQNMNSWVRIDCMDNGKLLSKKTVHNKVRKALEEFMPMSSK